MTRRLLPAAGVSSVGFLATFCWYYLSAPKLRVRADATPIAYLDSSPKDVQRKASDHLIWEEVKKGEILFARDTVRASGQSAARIRMEESGSTIELEPDSVIVLEQNQGKVSLNLVNGGLFVKNESGKTTGTPNGLEIKVGGTKLAASSKGLEMNIHRDKSGEASIVVAKGNVTAVAAGKSFAVAQGKSGSLDAKGLETGKLLQVLQPAANAVIDLGKGDGLVTFRWAPLEAEMEVYLELGDSPGQLQRVNGPALGTAGALAARVPRGDHYWRLVAAKKDGSSQKASVPLKLTAMLIQPPELTGPADHAPLELKEASLVTKLSWAGSGIYEGYEIKYGKSADLHDASTLKAGEGEDQVTITLNAPATYYWKVIGMAKGEHRRVDSSLRSFSLTKVDAKPPPPPAPPKPQVVKAPVLMGPQEGAKLNIVDAQNGVQLRWQAVTGATSYEVKIEPSGGGAPLHETVTEPQYTARLPEAGSYRWSVQAAVDTTKSPWAAAKNLSVAAGRITVREDPSNADNVKPIYKMSWSRGASGAVKWRVAVATDADLAGAKYQTFNETTAQLQFGRFGDYYIKVEGLDTANRVVAESDARQIKIKPPRKLDPPELIEARHGSRLMANASGDVSVKWRPVEHASGYMVSVRDPDGSVVFKNKTAETFVDLRHLMPGKHSLYLGTYNTKEELGPVKVVKEIEVPAVSAAKPPAAINEIHIK